MAKRMIPFGYQIEAGKITVRQEESKDVIAIFESYVSGLSLKSIADAMIERGATYNEGKPEWDKHRIKRIIEDARYTGDDKYPAIIDSELFAKVREIKSQRNTQKDNGQQTVISRFKCPVVCGSCGSEMKRGHEKKRTIKDYWICSNPECGQEIRIDDTDFLRKITEWLNRLIANPNLIKASCAVFLSVGDGTDAGEAAETPEVRRIESEIERMLDSISIDKERMRVLIYDCALEKYTSKDDKEIISELLKAEFEKSNPLFSFDRDILERTVSEIRLSRGGEVKLVLKNNVVIGKENQDAGDHRIFGTGENHTSLTG